MSTIGRHLVVLLVVALVILNRSECHKKERKHPVPLYRFFFVNALRTFEDKVERLVEGIEEKLDNIGAEGPAQNEAVCFLEWDQPIAGEDLGAPGGKASLDYNYLYTNSGPFTAVTVKYVGGSRLVSMKFRFGASKWTDWITDATVISSEQGEEETVIFTDSVKSITVTSGAYVNSIQFELESGDVYGPYGTPPADPPQTTTFSDCRQLAYLEVRSDPDNIYGMTVYFITGEGGDDPSETGTQLDNLPSKQDLQNLEEKLDNLPSQADISELKTKMDNLNSLNLDMNDTLAELVSKVDNSPDDSTDVKSALYDVQNTLWNMMDYMEEDVPSMRDFIGAYGGSSAMDFLIPYQMHGMLTAVTVRYSGSITDMKFKFGQSYWSDWIMDAEGKEETTVSFDTNRVKLLTVTWGISLDSIQFVLENGDVFGPYGGSGGSATATASFTDGRQLAYLDVFAADRIYSVTVYTIG